jgi:hypothetical protein
MMVAARHAMGIKFHCPNGHKLNVKAFLAGKRGVCPKCGSKFRIPSESEPGLDSDLDEDDAAGSSISKNNGSGAATATAVHSPAAPAVATAPVAAPAARGTAADPIEENPAAIWYVRPPTGGQYGPARGDIMRRWLTEGRVSSDSLVWREGWTDWQNAGKTFPALESGAAPPPTPEPAVSTTVPLSRRSSHRVATRYETKKQSTSSTAIAVLVGLVVLCVILSAVLVYAIVNLQ